MKTHEITIEGPVANKPNLINHDPAVDMAAQQGDYA